MSVVKHIFSGFLISMLLSSWMPISSLVDATRDNNIDLRDAILQVMDFARSAEQPELFSISVKKAFATLDIVAGVKTDIKRIRETGSASDFHFFDHAYLISTCDSLSFSNQYSKVPVQFSDFRSFFFSPDSPPPRA